jgi:hypothetical protein
MDSLRGKKATMALDLPGKKLYMRDRVEILRSWKVPLFMGGDRLGRRIRLRIKSLENPSIEAAVDFADVLMRE